MEFMTLIKNKLNRQPTEIIIKELRDLLHSNEFAKVEKKAKELIDKYSNSSTLLNILGVSLIGQKKLNGAKKIFTKLIELEPDFAEAYNNLGTVYIKERNNDKAIFYFEKALIKKQDFTQAQYNLAKIYTELGDELHLKNQFEDAIKNYELAIKNKFDFVDAYNNLGITLEKLNRFDDAKNIFKKAIEIKPDYFLAHNNLGNILMSLGKNNEAIKNYLKAIKTKPNYFEAHCNLGIALNAIGNFEESILHFEKAIKIKPDFEAAYNNLAVSLVNQGKFENAAKIYEKALELNPNKTQYAINAHLLVPIIPESSEDLKYWRDKYISSIDLLRKYKYSINDPQNTINPPAFNLSYSEFNNLEVAKKLSKLFRDIIPIINYNININTKTKNKSKIKLGFISEFFTDHSIGKLYRGLIKMLNKNEFEITVFHLPKTKHGLIKKEIDNYSDYVINLTGKINNQQRQIQNQFLDIIFYPDIGMSPSTYFLAHARLAPVQIMSWGHPETSGIDTIDYFLSSSLIENKNSNLFYSEKLVCLNRIPMYFIPPNMPNIKLSRKDFGLPENANLYCCPQTLFKIHPDFDDALSKIINKDSNSKIIMIGHKYKSYEEKLKKRWNKNHPNLNEKVIFLKRMSSEKFLALIKISNVLLDSFYFGAGVSFTESMVVGTPTVTMPGIFMRSRIAAGAYKQMNISNPPIAKNLNDYVNIAIDLANDKKKNIQLKETLKQAAKIHLFNDLKAVKEFEEFFKVSCNSP